MTHNLTTVLLAAALSFATATATATATASAEDHAKDSRLYELRTYHAEAGKLDALLARFRDHTVKLFEKNGMTNIGYWVPVDNKDNLLIYLLAYPDRTTRDASWEKFLADDDWKKAAAASEMNGRLVSKADQLFLTATDFSPGSSKCAPTPPPQASYRLCTAASGTSHALFSPNTASPTSATFSRLQANPRLTKHCSTSSLTKMPRPHKNPGKHSVQIPPGWPQKAPRKLPPAAR